MHLQLLYVTYINYCCLQLQCLYCVYRYVATNMSSHKGHRTPSQGAATFIDLALNHEFANTTGQFFYDSTPVSYLNKNM